MCAVRADGFLPSKVSMLDLYSGLLSREPYHFSSQVMFFGKGRLLFRELAVSAQNPHKKKIICGRRALRTSLESDVSGEILRYFQVRGKWERHEYVVPVTEDFEFLKEARRRFHGDRFESLYQAWSAGTITERDLRLEFSQL